MKVGVAREIAPEERRVALVPDAIEKLRGANMTVLVERGAGAAASFPDQSYVEAGAKIVTTATLYSTSDVILRIHRPTPAEAKLLHEGQVVIGLLAPLLDPRAMADLARQRVTAISLDAIPRTLSRAQGMDALSSQANVGGYKAVLIAAEGLRALLPAAHDAGRHRQAGQRAGARRRRGRAPGDRHRPPARGRWSRPTTSGRETKEQAESLGAQFVTLKSAIDATGQGGYARALTAEEQAAQQAELNDIIAASDIVITTAQVPGRRPPVLVTARRGRRHEDRLGHRRHGRQRARRQLRAVQAGQGRDQPERRRDPRPAQPAGVDADRRQHLLLAQHLQPAAQLRRRRKHQPRLRR